MSSQTRCLVYWTGGKRKNAELRNITRLDLRIDRYTIHRKSVRRPLPSPHNPYVPPRSVCYNLLARIQHKQAAESMDILNLSTTTPLIKRIIISATQKTAEREWEGGRKWGGLLAGGLHVWLGTVVRAGRPLASSERSRPVGT